jgi:hypothetical protein
VKLKIKACIRFSVSTAMKSECYIGDLI